ncbi:MAG: hypothetical protein K2K22_01475 [Muribaculaceae bacterium]|nr:hypothetical protein [Muribaculaceae bacterium]
MKRILIWLFILLAIYPISAETSIYRTHTGRFQNVDINDKRIVRFIEDVVIPVAKSADYKTSTDEIFIEFKGNNQCSVEITFYKHWGYSFFLDGVIEKDSVSQYVAWIAGVPVFVSGPKLHYTVLNTYSYITLGAYFAVLTNDDCATWVFNLHDGVLSFDKLWHFKNSWIRNKLYRSLLPPEIRIKRLDQIAARISLPAVSQKPTEAVAITEYRSEPKRKARKIK